MLRSKYFWIALLIGVPFLIIWITTDIVCALIYLVCVIILGAMITSQAKNKQVTRYRIYEDRPDEYYPEPEERYIVINKRQRSDIQRGLDWHVPKVNRSGAEFLSGSNSLKRAQQDEMKRIKKNLWG